MSTPPISRRHLVLAAASLGAGIAPALADPAPKKIRIVSPYPAGGSVDFWARNLKLELERQADFSVQVANIPGASGVLAANQIHNATEDHQTTLLLAGTALFSQLPLLPDSNLQFNPNAAFMPLAILWEEPFFLAVRSDAPYRSLNDLVSIARKPDARISVGSIGLQSTGGMCFDFFLKKQRLEMTHVPFKGMTEVVTNLLGNHIDIGLLSYQQARKHLEAQTFRLLATTGDDRSPLEPGVPTLKELKFVDFGCTAWFGLFVKKTADPALVRSLQTALGSVLGNDSFRTIAATNGFSILALVGNDADHYVRRSNAIWTRLLNQGTESGASPHLAPPSR